MFNKNKKYNKMILFGVGINTKDSDEIYKIFQKIGDWKIYNYKKFDKRTNKYYNSSTIQTCNENLINFLIDNDYDKKSIVSPYKILNKIPDNLKNHFYRGFSDGDGCFYNKNRICQYILTGSYEQNWDWIEDVLKNFNIIYSKNTQENKKGKSSRIRFVNINDIIKFGDFIYQNWNNVGLERKYNKYLEMIKLEIKPVHHWSNDDIKLLFDNYKYGAIFCSKILNRSANSIRIYYCKNKNQYTQHENKI